VDWQAVISTLLQGGTIAAVLVYFVDRARVRNEAKQIENDCDNSQVQAAATLSALYEKRLKTLDDKVAALEGKIDNLECEIENREVTIEKLKRENIELTSQVEKLTKALARKDAKVLELQKQVAELTARLDAMNGCGDVD